MNLLPWPIFWPLIFSTLVLPWHIPYAGASNRAAIATVLFVVASVFMPGQNGEILLATLPGAIVVWPVLWIIYAILDRRAHPYS